ncbi:hypothetical protein EZV73_23755 [Acidaminobacter sp. JC074]|uniref:hypothetical protein n=1 Tax=Acidaminobacter sp. JC074 TaxID=2530199 RepID=UPI001F0F92A7|nr:hypothetical protein [Acidaminobacter sp. JC074]MCH4890618.1 hypothetical protein [Acidaminobacter sp. JC074]
MVKKIRVVEFSKKKIQFIIGYSILLLYSLAMSTNIVRYAFEMSSKMKVDELTVDGTDMSFIADVFTSIASSVISVLNVILFLVIMMALYFVFRWLFFRSVTEEKKELVSVVRKTVILGLVLVFLGGLFWFDLIKGLMFIGLNIPILLSGYMIIDKIKRIEID